MRKGGWFKIKLPILLEPVNITLTDSGQLWIIRKVEPVTGMQVQHGLPFTGSGDPGHLQVPVSSSRK